MKKFIPDKKAYLIILLFLLAAGFAVFLYVKVSLLHKTQAAVLRVLTEYTARRVTLGNIHLHLFKGVVIRDIVIYDEAKPVVTIPEIASGLFFPALTQKGIIVPQVTVSGPVISVKRSADGSWDFMDMFSPDERPAASAAGIKPLVRSIKVLDGRILFRDETVSPALNAVFERVRARAWFESASRIRVHLKTQAQSGGPTRFDIKAVIPLKSQEDIRLEAVVDDVRARELNRYLEQHGLVAAGGSMDAKMECLIRDSRAQGVVSGHIRDVTVTRGLFLWKARAGVSLNFKSDFRKAHTAFAGRLSCEDARIEGIEAVGPVTDISGELVFSSDQLSSDALRATIWGIPADVRFSFSGKDTPLLALRIKASSDLEVLQRVARRRKFLDVPGLLSGDTDIVLDLRTYPAAGGVARVSGTLDVRGGRMELEELEHPLSGLSGRLEFGKDFLHWAGLRGFYGKKSFQSDGKLRDFNSPRISASLASEELSLETNMGVEGGMAQVYSAKGEYRGCLFDLSGSIFLPDVMNTKTRVKGKLTFDADNIVNLLPDPPAELERMGPDGVLDVSFTAEGIARYPGTLACKARVVSPRVRAYGFTARKLRVDYEQSQGVAEVPHAEFLFYGGRVSASGTVNIAARPAPYWLSLAFDDVHLEEIKQDTAARKKDITGSLSGEVKLRGAARRPELVKGSGVVIARNAKLWELNLFRKLGKLLFAPEYFTRIVFNEGSCNFVVRDEAVWSEDIALKSQVSTLKGAMKVGFDGSLRGALEVKVLDQLVPLTGTFKDVTTAIVGRADRFGVIKVGGTLRQPEYSFQTAVGGLIQGIQRTIQEALFGNY